MPEFNIFCLYHYHVFTFRTHKVPTIIETNRKSIYGRGGGETMKSLSIDKGRGKTIRTLWRFPGFLPGDDTNREKL